MISAHLKPQLTKEDYAKAVGTLLTFAVKDCGGSKACAIVLLNAYNYTAFHLDITDLCGMDANLYSAALVVIRARVELCTEPHNLIADGSRVFDELWKQWDHLSLLKGH